MSEIDPHFDPYAALGLSSQATPSDIKHAFRRLAAELHPDRNSDPNAVERFKQVVTAWELLSDEGTKAAYDRLSQPMDSDEWPWTPEVPTREDSHRPWVTPVVDETTESRRRRRAQVEEHLEKRYREREAHSPPEEPSSSAWRLATSIDAWAAAAAAAAIVWSLLPSTHLHAILLGNPWTWRLVLWGLCMTGCVLVWFRESIDDSPLGRLWAIFVYDNDPRGIAPHRVVGILEGGPGVIALTGWLLLLGTPLVISVFIAAGEKLP